jgi:hypothetical protein
MSHAELSIREILELRLRDPSTSSRDAASLSNAIRALDEPPVVIEDPFDKYTFRVYPGVPCPHCGELLAPLLPEDYAEEPKPTEPEPTERRHPTWTGPPPDAEVL